MLRGFVIALALFFVFGGVVAWRALGTPGGWFAIGFGVLLLLGTVFEQVRYKEQATAAPGPGWERTSERFVDEESGKTVTVYIRPETGERKYVED